MLGSEVYISERLARMAAAVVISMRGINGAEPYTRRAMRREHDGTLTQGFNALVRFPDGRVVSIDHLRQAA